VGERVWPVVLASAVVVLGLLAVLPGDGDDAADPVPWDPVAAFLAAYERSRTATFVVEQLYTRTTPAGAELSYGRRLVQRPPDDRLLVGGGGADGRLDGRIVRCNTAPGGTSNCIEGPEARPYEEEVAAEVAVLRDLVTGEEPIYAVEAGAPGCFALRLRFDVPTPPYGELAGFCFDDATGAPTRLEERRAEATDVVEALEIRAEVTTADLRPGDLGDLPSTPTTL